MKTDLRNSDGVALLAALLVLFVMSILAIGMLTNVEEDLRIAKNSENSERALKIAESGIQVARASFFNVNRGANTNTTQELRSVSGFINGGYFLAQMEAGFIGREKWPEWRYDGSLSGNNNESEISAPIMKAWNTGTGGRNGAFESGSSVTDPKFGLKNLYSVVAGGMYFPIEAEDGNTVYTKIRAHDEYTGSQELEYSGTSGTGWQFDKTLKLASTAYTGAAVKYSAAMSPITSYSDYDPVPGQQEPKLTLQTLYFTYNGSSADIPSSSSDLSSTVRLRAVDALCNTGFNAGADADAINNDPKELATLWEFDTGMHGLGTPPALFDPTPDDPGDEILYFAVVSMENHDLHYSNAGKAQFSNYPSEAGEAGEQIYIFAIVDTSGKTGGVQRASCPVGTTYKDSYVVKWTRPFPDPDVVEWTDYPSEHVTGQLGTSAPYVSRPSDLAPAMPEDDLLVDYRDGPGDSAGGGLTATEYGNDGQWNQMRGNLLGEYPQALGPVMVNVLYHDSSGALTTNRADAADSGQEYTKLNPRIDLYFMYAMYSRVVHYWDDATETGLNDNKTKHSFWNSIRNINHGASWGNAGYRKPNASQTRLVSLRDRLERDSSGWDWKDPGSRFPEFKWAYRVPPWDPNRTDDIPPTGYGEYTWDTYFYQQIAPMVSNMERDATRRSNLNGGAGQTYAADGDGLTANQNLYTVIYPPYKSNGMTFADGGYGWGVTGNTAGPTAAQGATENFSGQVWDVARLMLMAVRDTWDDYENGNAGLPYADYWNYADIDMDTTIGNAPAAANYTYPSADTVTMPIFNLSLGYPFPAGMTRPNDPAPYVWGEDLWTVNVAYFNEIPLPGASTAAPAMPYNTANSWGLHQQGWLNVIGTTKTGSGIVGREFSMDIDVEGETASICRDCEGGDGLIILPFNHDTQNGTTTPDLTREDMRVHAINARTGMHVWDFHAASSLKGDNSNSTPAIANGKVFVGYMGYGSDFDIRSTNAATRDLRKAYLEVLDINDGRRRQGAELRATVDDDADAFIMAPSIANGMVYVATYDFENTVAQDNDVIRMFSLTPMLRLVSTGIYPKEQIPFDQVNHDDMLRETEEDENYGVKPIRPARRKLQVWINGESSRWEEVRDTISTQ